MKKPTKKLKFAKPKKVKVSTLKRKCDTLFGKLIRSRGHCELKGMDSIACKGSLQTMHIISRRYLKFRWDKIAVFCGCAAHHYFYTTHPEEWYSFMEKHYRKLWHMLLSERFEAKRINYEYLYETLKNSSTV